MKSERRLLRLATLALTTLGLLAVSTHALAATDPEILPTTEEIKKAVDDDKKKEGWDPALSLGASLALSSNSNVVGQPDGASITLGLNLLGRLDWLDGPHDWRNTLKLNEAFTQTPVIDEFVKTIDVLTFESIYYFKATEQFGPFASFKLESAMFEGNDVRPSDVTYVNKADGTTIAVNDRLPLTDSFQPLTLKEAIGAFYRPISQKTIEVDIRAGFGAAQTFAEGGRFIADDGATAEIEVGSLSDFVQAGAVVGLTAKGELEEGRIGYEARGEVMIPFINDDVQGRSATELTNYDFGVKLAFKLFEWVSLDYEFKAFKQPELLDEWQIQNNLLLTFSYTLIE